ncbi:MAG: hypothetical protein ACT4QC_14865 [Planctomycetaceae bacterium]
MARRLRVPRVLAVALCACALRCAPAFADPADADEPVETGAPAPRESMPADRQEAAKRAYATGIVMLGGILICGVGLVAMALLWGSRTRRIARQSLPDVALRDELWFLKHKPPTPAADDPPQASEGGSQVD